MPQKTAWKLNTKAQLRSSWKDRKAQPKQPLSSQDRLKRLFTSLCAQIDGGYFTNAVKTCDKILRLEPSDQDAQRTKLFLLLQIEQYDEALLLIGSSQDPKAYSYERAYTLYRKQQETESRGILETLKQEKGEDDRGIVHLEAQLNYREGSYQEAFEMYNQLLDTAESNSEEHFDISTNLQASQKHLDFINTGFHHALDALPTTITSTLETAPPPVHQPSIAAAVTSASAPAEREESRIVPKKVRARRVPAGVIPGVTPPPDPERWLKKIERSTFNQGKRRKGAGGGGATQGAAVDATPTPGGAPHTSKSGGKGKKKK
ncbi:hypothetical protein CPB83DRAFT_860398 [Crepidotus variabilis]|uniref:Signal recognition particle subunit SRP72 n=1 Tax=Crepidotus variabilis TaxID=179855 RepID=A0A9P6E9N1_9AGAR|nr:hypothetical protein CPB83DRAFT_860398 [Crepidotus variabilis]